MSKQDYHAQQREKPEPEEGARPVPRSVFVLVFVLLAWGGGYILSHTGYPLRGGDSRTAAAETGADSIDGAALYTSACAACHQASGQGLPGVFPPLAGSDWVSGESRILIAIANDGLQGRIVVNGTTFNGVMPPQGSELSAAELAAVLNHVRSSWGNDAAPITPESVKGYRKEYAGHGPWTAEGLRSAFEP